MLSLQRYRDLFAVPDLRRTVTFSIAGRMPIGIAGLAILLFVQGRANSFALGGTASAVYVLGLGVIAPFLGRLMDQLGPRPVLGTCALLYPAALLTLVALVLSAAHPVLICAAALVAGATLPPVSACIRALYPRMIREPALLHTAYSVDSALVEAVFILGPALVALCVAARHPEAAVLLGAVTGAVGTTLFMRAPPVKGWVATSRTGGRERAVVLHHPRLVVVFAVTLLYSVAFGLFEVAVTAHAASKGAPAVAGVALALASLGSGVGALVYGARHWRARLHVQFVFALVMMLFGMLVLVPIDDLRLYTVANIAAGMPMATVIATQSLLVSRYSPRERLAESFTWSATCLLVGIGAGIAIGGALAEVLPAYWLLLFAAAATASAAVVAALALKEPNKP